MMAEQSSACDSDQRSTALRPLLYLAVILLGLFGLLVWSVRRTGPVGVPADSQVMYELWNDDYELTEQVKQNAEDFIGPPWPIGFSRRQFRTVVRSDSLIIARLGGPRKYRDSAELSFHGADILAACLVNEPDEIDSLRSAVLKHSMAIPSHTPETMGNAYGLRFIDNDADTEDSAVVDILVECEAAMYIFSPTELRHCGFDAATLLPVLNAAVGN